MLMGTDKYTVSEMELHEIPTPEPTRTYHPVPHGVFASEVERVIAHNGFSINRTDKTRVCLAGTGSECQRLELSVACYQNFRTGRHRPAEFHPQMDAIDLPDDILRLQPSLMVGPADGKDAPGVPAVSVLVPPGLPRCRQGVAFGSRATSQEVVYLLLLVFVSGVTEGVEEQGQVRPDGTTGNDIQHPAACWPIGLGKERARDLIALRISHPQGRHHGVACH